MLAGMHQPSLPTPLTHSIGWSGAAAVIAGAAMGAPAGARVACALSSWLPGPGGCVPAGALVGALLALGALPLLGQGTRRGESAAHRPAPTTTTAARLVWLAIAAALGRWLAQGLLHPQLVIRVGPPSPAVALHMLDSLGSIADIPAGFRTRSGDLRVAHLSAQAIEIDGQLEALCTIRDSRDPTSAERRAAAGEELVRILTGTASPEPARAALQAIGECLHWELGVLWRVDPMAEQLTCEAAWRRPLAELGALEESRWRGGFSPGNGLPGRIWQASQAAWITDLAEEAELGDGAGTDEGADGEAVHGWFGFPVVVGDEVLGVVEFFSSEARQVDPELVQMTARFGRLFGRLLGGAEQQEEADKEEGPSQEGAAGRERFLDAAAHRSPERGSAPASRAGGSCGAGQRDAGGHRRARPHGP
jgi:hypothetical protein